MIKMDLLDYEVYAKREHIADFDDVDEAKRYAQFIAHEHMVDTRVICKWTGEIITEFVVKTTTQIKIVEVKP